MAESPPNITNEAMKKLQIHILTLFTGLIVIDQGSAFAFTWIKLAEWTKNGQGHSVYVNSATFRRSGNTASAMVEDTEEKRTFQWTADCAKWRYKVATSSWQQAPRNSVADTINSFMCSDDRISKPIKSRDNDSNVNIKIQPPSVTDRVKGRIMNHMLDQMLFGY